MPPPGTRLARFDHHVRDEGYDVLVGTDEVGRGCLAGPVVAAAVALPPNVRLPRVDDSKLLSADERETQALEIRGVAWAATVSFFGPRAIDRLNIRTASLLAMRRAIERARVVLARRMRAEATARDRTPADSAAAFLVLVDGRDAVPGARWDQRAIIDGDARSLAIAAASILAKTVRDRYMMRLSAEEPRYGFEHHKGYGTPEHLKALEAFGPCRYHRYSFFPVAQPKLFV